MEAQFRIRQQAQELQDHLLDLKRWEEQQKAKDRQLSQGGRHVNGSAAAAGPTQRGSSSSSPVAIPAVRGSASAPRPAPKGTSAAAGSATAPCPPPTATSGRGAGSSGGSSTQRQQQQQRQRHPSAHTYEHYASKWDKFDVDAALASDEEEDSVGGRHQQQQRCSTSITATAAAPNRNGRQAGAPPTSLGAPGPAPLGAAGISVAMPTARGDDGTGDEAGCESGGPLMREASTRRLPPKPAQQQQQRQQRAGAAAQSASAHHQQQRVADHEADPSTAEGWKDRGNALFRAGRYAEAKDAYSSSLALSPTCLAHANRAMACIKLGEHAQAERDCTSALGMDPMYVKAYQRRSAARRALGRPSDAAEDLQEALRLEPGNSALVREFYECLEEAHMAGATPPLPTTRVRLPVARAPVAVAIAEDDDDQPSVPSPTAAPAVAAAATSTVLMPALDASLVGLVPMDTSPAPAPAPAPAPRSSAMGARDAAPARREEEQKATVMPLHETSGGGVQGAAVHPSPEHPAVPADIVVMGAAIAGSSPLANTAANAAVAAAAARERQAPTAAGLVGAGADAGAVEAAALPRVAPSPAATKQQPMPAAAAAAGQKAKGAAVPTAISPTAAAIAAPAPRAAAPAAAAAAASGKAAAAVAMLHSGGRAMKPPRTGTEFETAWKGLRNEPGSAQAQYLALVHPDSLPALFRHQVTAPLLSSVAEVALRHMLPLQPSLAVSLLEALASTPRFGIASMLVPPRDKATLGTAWDDAEHLLQQQQQDVGGGGETDLCGRLAAARRLYKV